VVEELGFDACVDYKKGSLQTDLAAAAPGGSTDTSTTSAGCAGRVMACMNPHGRIAMCGAIAAMRDRNLLWPTRPDPGFPAAGRGFIVVSIRTIGLSHWTNSAVCGGGAIRFRESIAEGLASDPKRFSACWPGATSVSNWCG